MPAPRATLALLAVVVFADSLAQSISFPLLPRLTASVVGGGPADTARWVGFLEVGWALPYFLAAPVLGLLADRFGRKPIIVLSLLGIGVELLCNVLAQNVGWLLAGRISCGLTFGGQLAALAYVADVVPPERRTAAFGWINAALYGGIMAGPLLGGALAGIDLRLPFQVACAVAFAAAVFALLFLKESLPPDRRSRSSRADVAPWRTLSVLRGPGLPVLTIIFALVWLSYQGSDNLTVLYTADRYGWTPLQFGALVTLLAALGLLAQGLLAGRLAARWGDRRTLIVGLSLQAAGVAAMGLAPASVLFVAATLPAMLGSVARPALQSLMSARVGPDEQGRLQGAMAAVGGLTSVAAPILSTQLYAWTLGRPEHTDAWSGLTLVAAGGVSALAALVVLTRTAANRSA